MVSPELLEKRITEYLEGTDPRLGWVREAVRHHRFLPLYLGWVSVLGIHADGSFVRWDFEEDRSAFRPLRDEFWQRTALVAGARAYPELRALLPARPAEAATCSACQGAGRFPQLEQIICACGGVGWVVPNVTEEPSPG